MGLAVQPDVGFNRAMPARRAVSQIVRAAEIVAFVVAATSFMLWLAAVALHDPHHWQDQWLATASPTLTVTTVVRRSWERFVDRRRPQHGIVDKISAGAAGRGDRCRP
jgi:hypothetical protein